MTDISADDVLEVAGELEQTLITQGPIDFGGRARRIEDVVDPEVPIAEEFQRGTGTIDLRGLAQRVREPQPDLGERLTTIGQGATAGAAQGLPVVAGVVMGAKVGGALGAFGGPLAPVTVPVGLLAGGTVGLVSGMMAGEELQRQLSKVSVPGTDTPLTYENLESVPLNLRPYAVGGEVVGASVPFAGLPYVAAAKDIRFVENLPGRIINHIIESAGTMPARFALAESSAAFGAAVGGGVAESAFPGEFGPRFAGEVIGGVMNPTRYVISGSRAAIKTAERTIFSFTPAGKRLEAVTFLQRALKESGGDPELLAEAIARGRAEFPQLNLTPAQITNNPFLIALENRLVQESGQFGQDSRRMAEESLGTLRTMIGVLESAGDPAAFKAAAQIRKDYFTTLLATRLHVAQQEVVEAASRIDPANPASTAEYGRNVSKIMSDALGEVRAVERELWGKIDDGIEATGEGVVARFDELSAGRLPEESLPAVVEAFVKRLRDETTTSGELIIFRSRMLALAREASAKNEFSDARIFGELAESARDDLDVLFDGSPEYDAARTYSRELHDTFTRTFAGATQETRATGAARIPPEIVMNRAFGVGREVGELQLRELEGAARMAGGEHVSRILDIQEQTIRFAGKRLLNPASGRVEPRRLAKFLLDNAEVLKRFPEIAKNLKNVKMAEEFLRSTEAGNTVADKAIRARAAFSRVLKFEDPSRAVGQAVNGAFPERNFNALAKLARQGGNEAKEGFRVSVFNHAYNRAAGAGDTFNFAAYRDSFEKPLTATGTTLRDLMVNSGVATRKQMDTLSRFLERAVEIEDTLRAGDSLDEVLSVGDAMVDLSLRISGARAATLVPGPLGASQLVIAGATSKAMRQVLDKIPQSKAKFFLIEASKDPKLMEALLKEAQTPAERIRLARQMNAFLWQTGITTPDQEETTTQ